MPQFFISMRYFLDENKIIRYNYDRCRDDKQNSITELYFASPQATDIKDITVCEIDMGPDGSLNFKKNNSNGSWDNFATTNDIMAQLGTQKNGVVGEFVPEGQQRATEYTMELFIPWGYVDKIAGEGTADVIKNGGEIYLNATPITSYNYLGTDGDVDRWWWMIGSQLDDGSWGNTRGWYHFNKDGLVAYDIEIEMTGDGVVMERMNYDFAVANNSVTFLTHPADGCALTEITVNGKSYSDSVAFVGDGYFVVPASEVTQDLKVVAVFETYDPSPQDFEATVTALYYGTSLNLDGAQLLLDGTNDYTLDISGGKVVGEIPYGTYTVSLVGDDFTNYDSIQYIFRSEQAADFQFSYNMFTANMIYGKGGEVDNSHSNDAQNAYVSNISAGQMWAVMTDETTDGAFTVNVQNSDSLNNGNIYIAYILDQTKIVVFQVRLEEGEFFVQWRIWLSDFGINDSNILSPNDWTSASLPAFTDAYKGDGVDVTLVREGSAFYVFASEHGKPDTAKLALQYTVSAGYAETLGNWAFGGSDITANAKFEFEAGIHGIHRKSDFRQ